MKTKTKWKRSSHEAPTKLSKTAQPHAHTQCKAQTVSQPAAVAQLRTVVPRAKLLQLPSQITKQYVNAVCAVVPTHKLLSAQSGTPAQA
jgi:hypothetical protein